ncbi:MAG: hypothetical protein R3C11_27750 [Planctomycetaceae bacterium]
MPLLEVKLIESLLDHSPYRDPERCCMIKSPVMPYVTDSSGIEGLSSAAQKNRKKTEMST